MTISLAISSLNPNVKWLNQLLASAVGFDEIVLYIHGRSPINVNEAFAHYKVFQDEKPHNIAEGFNFAFSKTTGDWIIPCGDDDWFNPEMLYYMLRNLREGRWSDADIIYTQNIVDGQVTPPRAENFTLEDILKENQLPAASFFKRSVYNALGGYKESDNALFEDWNFWIRAKKAGFVFKYVPGGLYHYRVRPDSASQTVLIRDGYEETKRKTIEGL